MKTKFMLVTLLLLTLSHLVAAQMASSPSQTPQTTQAAQQVTPPPPPPPNLAAVLDRQLSNVEREFVGAAEAMPEEKYGFAPTNGEFKGVRTFAQQVKHVAFTNNQIFSAILGDPAPADAADDNGPTALKSKAEIVKYLKDSFALGHRAMASINEQNMLGQVRNPFGGPAPVTRIGIATLNHGHCFDHYGQMVEYLRMNGIIPPASRR